MKPDDVEARLRTGEDSRTEFKTARARLPERDDVAKEVSAFANSGGGDVFFGVTDDAEVEGVGGIKDAERLQRHLVQVCADSVTPPIRLATHVVEVRGELVVVARVPGYLPDRPFRGRTKYFVRDGNVAREARPDELKRSLISGANIYFDEQTAHGAVASDLDDDAIDEFLASAITHARSSPRERVLRSLKIVDVDGAPTFAGLLMFAREPQAFLHDAYVSVVRIDGVRFGDRTSDMKEVRGTLLEQLDACAEYLRLITPQPLEIEGTRRRTTGVPHLVWREALANALAHRDYQIPSQTRIFVFQDRVELANPGGLLNQLTIEGIKLGGISQRRNPYLAALIGRARGREGLGLGVPSMLQLVEETGLPSPEITVANGEFRLTIWTCAPRGK